MIGQDAILRLGLVIDGIKCYIKPSYAENTKLHINSVELSQPKHFAREN